MKCARQISCKDGYVGLGESDARTPGEHYRCSAVELCPDVSKCLVVR